MDEPEDPGPLNFASIGPVPEPAGPPPEPATKAAVPTPEPSPSGSWSIREQAPASDPFGQLPSWPASPPPPLPSGASPFLQTGPDGEPAEPQPRLSPRTAIAIVATTLLVAIAGVVGIAVRPAAARPAAVAVTTTTPAAETFSATATAVAVASGFDQSAAAQQYLSAVGPADQAGVQMTNLLNADMSKPCTCSPGEFSANDALLYLPTFNSMLGQSAAQLHALALTLPQPGHADVDAVASSILAEKAQLDTIFSTPVDSVAEYQQLATIQAQGVIVSDKAHSDLGLPPV